MTFSCQPSYGSPNSPYNLGDFCMVGTTFFKKDRRQWIVIWPWKGKRYHISRYKGRLMHQTHPNKKKDYGYIKAVELLGAMRSDVEDGCFRLEKYTGKNYTDVIPYFEKWLERKAKKKPATYKGYNSYYKNWIKPFFQKNPVQLHEVQLDTLDSLLDSIKLQPKGKHNVMMAFHAFMDYAWRSRRIPAVPPFPKKSDYELVEPSIKWLPEVRQMSIIDAIPADHRPIFLWLKYHARRPAEACALHKIDYNRFDQSFTIRRSISARKLVNSTKTRAEHLIPCHSAMIETIEALLDQNPDSPFMFTNPRARKKGARYTNESLNIIWKAACKIAGEDIDLYSGLKHSTLSQLYNEKGLSISDIQDVSDHARIESVRRYAKAELPRKRALMETPAPAAKIRAVK